MMTQTSATLIASCITAGVSLIILLINLYANFGAEKRKKRSIPILSYFTIKKKDDIISKYSPRNVRLYDFEQFIEEYALESSAADWIVYQLLNFDENKINDVCIYLEFLDIAKQTTKKCKYSVGFIFPNREILIPIKMSSEAVFLKSKILYITEYGEKVTYTSSISMIDLKEREDEIAFHFWKRKRFKQINKDLNVCISIADLAEELKLAKEKISQI